MFLISIIKYVGNLLVGLMNTLVDGLPPYLYVEGLLEGKEVLENGITRVLYISSRKVEVDRYTFEALMIGENLRIRSTRSYKAISIDRIIPSQGPV